MEELDDNNYYSSTSIKTWKIGDCDAYVYSNLGSYSTRTNWFDINSFIGGRVSNLLKEPRFEFISSAIDRIIKEFEYISEDIRGLVYFPDEHQFESETCRFNTLAPFQIITTLEFENNKDLLKVSFSTVGLKEKAPRSYMKEFKSSDSPEDIEKAVREIQLFMYDYENESLLQEEEEEGDVKEKEEGEC